MPKKSKSKRITLKAKHKVLRKVKEHHRKKRKEARKDGKTGRSMVDKDLGIPNEQPFKEQELKALEVRRAMAIKELEDKKEARRERSRNRKLGIPDDEDIGNDNDAVEETAALAMPKTNDHSERAFYKELVKVIEASDVILEVLDARDPLGTRCVDMEKMVRKADPTKRIVLLLNKIDLVPKESVEKWLSYLREELPTDGHHQRQAPPSPSSPSAVAPLAHSRCIQRRCPIMRGQRSNSARPHEDAARPGHIVVVLVSGHHHPDPHNHRCPVAHLSAAKGRGGDQAASISPLRPATVVVQLGGMCDAVQC